jgi:hypothetical protein
MKSKSIILSSCLLLVAAFLTGCASPDPYVRSSQRRGTIGGAGMGAIIGNNVSGISRGEGAAIGAVLGRSMGTTRGRANSAYYGRSRVYYPAPRYRRHRRY